MHTTFLSGMTVPGGALLAALTHRPPGPPDLGCTQSVQCAPGLAPSKGPSVLVWCCSGSVRTSSLPWKDRPDRQGCQSCPHWLQGLFYPERYPLPRRPPGHESHTSAGLTELPSRGGRKQVLSCHWYFLLKKITALTV